MRIESLEIGKLLWCINLKAHNDCIFIPSNTIMYQRFISILIKKLDDAINLKSYYFLEVVYILAIYVDFPDWWISYGYILFFWALDDAYVTYISFRMILKVHSSLEQKRILIVDNFSKKIKVSRQLNWHKVPLNLQKIFVVSTKLLTSPADLLRESEHKLHLVGKFIFE